VTVAGNGDREGTTQHKAKDINMADRYFSTEEEAIQDLVRRGLVVDSGQKRWCQRNASMLRGGENGFWELRLASGRWRQIPNAYQQALDEKMAVRDAMVSAYQRAAIIRHRSRQHQERRTADFRRRKHP